jgi:outer membrane protein OmpA-like peptidoglycan-associated protein
MGMPVNSSYDDMSLVLYADATGGYFASNRPAEKKGDNIYFLNNQHIYLSVKLLDAVTHMPIAAGNVVLESVRDKRSLTTDPQGHLFTQLVPQAQYGVVINKPGYDTKKVDVSTFNITGNDTIEQEILMDGNFAISYNAVVLDEKTGAPIEDPMVVFAKIGGSGTDSTKLATGQSFTSNLQPDAAYHVYPVKVNYYGSEKIVSTKGITRGIGRTDIKDTLYMKKLQVGEVYRIENIYYDYDKANIREDAKPSLNLLLELLNQYPQMRIQVNSHTDCRGSDAYNLRLSQGRANSVIKYLGERGISKDRLQYKGYGETAPVEKCGQCEKCTEEQHQKNRRTEFQIVTM